MVHVMEEDLSHRSELFIRQDSVFISPSNQTTHEEQQPQRCYAKRIHIHDNIKLILVKDQKDMGKDKMQPDDWIGETRD